MVKVCDSDVQSIVFTRDDYGDELWKYISETVQTLLRSKYVVKIYNDDGDGDIIVVQFAYADQDLTKYSLEWVERE